MTNLPVKPLEAIYYAGSIAGYALWAWRWFIRRHDRAIKKSDFIDRLEHNHLPHIYAALRAICTHLGITFEEPPLYPPED